MFRSSAPTSTPESSAARKQAIMDEVQQQLQVSSAQSLINVRLPPTCQLLHVKLTVQAQSMNEKCYAKCITKPAGSLSSSDEGCLSKCMDRYLEAFNIVSKTYVARVAREREQQQLATPAAPQL